MPIVTVILVLCRTKCNVPVCSLLLIVRPILVHEETTRTNDQQQLFCIYNRQGFAGDFKKMTLAILHLLFIFKLELIFIFIFELSFIIIPNVYLVLYKSHDSLFPSSSNLRYVKCVHVM